jgi:hypothetical protein
MFHFFDPQKIEKLLEKMLFLSVNSTNFAKNLPIFGYHEIEEKTLIPSLQTKSRANSRLYDWGPWEPRPLPRTPSKI